MTADFTDYADVFYPCHPCDPWFTCLRSVQAGRRCGWVRELAGDCRGWIMSLKSPNQSVERTGGSRFAHFEFERQWRLSPVAHAGRWPRAASDSQADARPGSEADHRRSTGRFWTARWEQFPFIFLSQIFLSTDPSGSRASRRSPRSSSMMTKRANKKGCIAAKRSGASNYALG